MNPHTELTKTWSEIEDVLEEYYDDAPPGYSASEMLRLYSTPAQLKKALRHIRSAYVAFLQFEQQMGPQGDPEPHRQQIRKIDSILRKLQGD